MRLRKATSTDAELLFRWRNDPVTRAASWSQEPLSREEHDAWLAKALSNPARHLLVAEVDGTPTGQARLDHIRADCYELSIAIDPDHRHRGLGRQLIALASEWAWKEINALELFAYVRPENAASRAAFASVGFQES